MRGEDRTRGDEPGLNEEERAYGRRLYDELKRLGHRSFLIHRLGYSKLQRLKVADRAATLELFRGSEYALLQRVKTDPPEDLAAFLAALVDVYERERAVGAAVVASIFFGGQFLF